MWRVELCVESGKWLMEGGSVCREWRVGMCAESGCARGVGVWVEDVCECSECMGVWVGACGSGVRGVGVGMEREG